MRSKTCQVLFRCDGSTTIGIGHVMRCLALADELRSEYRLASGFALRSDDSGVRLIRRHEYPVFTPRAGTPFDYHNWLCELASECRAQTLVLDVRDDLPHSALRQLNESGVLLVTVDDPSDRRLHTDLAFYPPVPQVDRMDWSGFAGKVYKGWDWIPLRREITAIRPYRPGHPVRSLLVTAGGSDPAGMTVRTVEFLKPLKKAFATVVVVGPAFQHHWKLEQIVRTAPEDFRIVRDPDSLPALMSQADLAVVSFGVTAYELAAIGVPSLYLCLTPDHEESASALVDKGVGVSLGLFPEMSGERFRAQLIPLLETPGLRHRMSCNGRTTVDGKGARRISDLIAEAVDREPNHD